MSQWGLFVMWCHPPHSHTSHLPSRHQYSHDPLQQPHGTEEDFSIINTLKPVTWAPPTPHLPRARNAASQPELSVLGAADPQSIAELVLSPGQQTRTIKIIQTPAFLSLPDSLSDLAASDGTQRSSPPSSPQLDGRKQQVFLAAVTFPRNFFNLFC